MKKFVLVTSIGTDDPLFPLNLFWGVSRSVHSMGLPAQLQLSWRLPQHAPHLPAVLHSWYMPARLSVSAYLAGEIQVHGIWRDWQQRSRPL